jgi:GntR family transcriptional repressor for pyruvate dehydrogenase complex
MISSDDMMNRSKETIVLTFQAVESKSLAEAVAEQLMAMIAKGQLKPGDRLPTEPELMKQFNVGRSTLREAVKSLVVAGLLETKRSSGTFVSQSFMDHLSQRLNWDLVFSAQELRYIIEIRCALEEQAAALAAERATPEQKQHLAELVDAISDMAMGPEKAVEHDIDFHLAIAEASHNPLLINLISNLRQLLHSYIKAGHTRHGYANQNQADEIADMHRPIVEAIQAGQADEAKKAMHAHFQKTTGWQLALADGDG